MRFQHTITLTAVTGHAEKAGKEVGDVGVSLTIKGEAHLDDLKGIIACEHTAQMLDHVYDGEGKFHTNNIETLALVVEHEDVTAKLRVDNDEKTFKDCTVDSIKVTPKLSRVIEFSARLKTHPASDADRGWLLGKLQRDVAVLLDSKRFKIQQQVKDDRQQDLGLGKPGAEAKAGKDQKPAKKGDKKKAREAEGAEA